MKTTILLTIEHSKPLPEITDVICQRVWPYGGGCITDLTAAIQEVAFVEDRTGFLAGYSEGWNAAQESTASSMEAMTAALESKYSTDCTSPDYLCPAGRVQIGLPAFRSEP